jgi:hypothetical protein
VIVSDNPSTLIFPPQSTKQKTKNLINNMTKQNFIALADVIIASAPQDRSSQGTFSRSAILELADFCASQNPKFMRQRWLDYIEEKCGKNGVKVK